jgi:hypothetical protein
MRELFGDLSRCAKDAGANRISDYYRETETDTKHSQQTAAMFTGVGGCFHRYM